MIRAVRGQRSTDRASRRAETDRRALVAELADARIGATFNQYAEGERAALLRDRLSGYLAARADAPILLVGEAPGYRGARVTGIPFTSERQLTGIGPAEATSTVVHRVLAALRATDDVLLWNVVPTHPGTPTSNRRPTRAEVASGVRFASELAAGREVIAIGRIAAEALGAPYVRHPSHGGAAAFASGLRAILLGRVRMRRSPTGRARAPASSPRGGAGCVLPNRGGGLPAWPCPRLEEDLR